jgi:serine/threonine protein phosphatase PrpC
MSDLNVLYVVTAVVLGGLTLWVLVVLFTAKDAPDESPGQREGGRAGDGAKRGIPAGGAGSKAGESSEAREGIREEPTKGIRRVRLPDETPPPSTVEVTVKSERAVEIAGRTAPVVIMPVMRQRLDSHREISDGGDAVAPDDEPAGEADFGRVIRDSVPPVSGQPLSLVSAVGRAEPATGPTEMTAIVDRHRLFILADGQGQRVQNELVSAVIVNALAAAFEVDEDATVTADATLPRRADRLRRAVLAADAALRTRGTAETLDSSRVFVLAAHFAPDNRHLYIVTSGPDRAYRLRGGDLVQLNKGNLSPESTDATRKVVVVVAETAPEDIYVFGSDAAFLALGDELRTVLAFDPSIDRVAAHFVEAATRGGKSTGMTAIVVQVNAARASLRPSAE